MFEDRMAYLQDIFRITGRNFGYFMYSATSGALVKKRKSPSSSGSVWNLAYAHDFEKGHKLYDLAKRKVWNPETDVDWDTLAPSGQLLTRGEYWAAEQMGLTQFLDEKEKIELSRQEFGWMISQILHGEQGSLLICGQLVNMRPDMDGKLFLATQVMDEARHVEVFTRYLDKFSIYEADLNIRVIIDSLLGTSDWHKKAIGMLILVEGYAMGAFSYARRLTTDPCLVSILDLVMQDEGRHVGFGIDSIAEEVNHLDAKKREELEDYAFSLCRTLFFGRERGGFRSNVENYWKKAGGRMGISRQEFDKLAVNNKAMNDFQYDVFHNHLMANLKRINLLSDRVSGEYRALGLPA